MLLLHVVFFSGVNFFEIVRYIVSWYKLLPNKITQIEYVAITYTLMKEKCQKRMGKTEINKHTKLSFGFRFFLSVLLAFHSFMWCCNGKHKFEFTIWRRKMDKIILPKNKKETNKWTNGKINQWRDRQKVNKQMVRQTNGQLSKRTTKSTKNESEGIRSLRRRYFTHTFLNESALYFKTVSSNERPSWTPLSYNLWLERWSSPLKTKEEKSKKMFTMMKQAQLNIRCEIQFII